MVLYIVSYQWYHRQFDIVWWSYDWFVPYSYRWMVLYLE